MTKAQIKQHKAGNQQRKQRNIAGRNPTGYRWPSIQTHTKRLKLTGNMITVPFDQDA